MAESLPLDAIAPGELRLPGAPLAIVVIANDGGSDDVVCDALHEGQFATLRLDHAAPYAGANGGHVRHLTERLVNAAAWMGTRPKLRGLPIGIFGAFEGAAAALAAAAMRPHTFRALVLRDGRPHASGVTLDDVRAATLLIVDGRDEASIAANQETMTHVKGIAELEILPTPTLTDDDPGTHGEIARLALRWFDRFLV